MRTFKLLILTSIIFSFISSCKNEKTNALKQNDSVWSLDSVSSNIRNHYGFPKGYNQVNIVFANSAYLMRYLIRENRIDLINYSLLDKTIKTDKNLIPFHGLNITDYHVELTSDTTLYLSFNFLDESKSYAYFSTPNLKAKDLVNRFQEKYYAEIDYNRNKYQVGVLESLIDKFASHKKLLLPLKQYKDSLALCFDFYSNNLIDRSGGYMSYKGYITTNYNLNQSYKEVNRDFYEKSDSINDLLIRSYSFITSKNTSYTYHLPKLKNDILILDRFSIYNESLSNKIQQPKDILYKRKKYYSTIEALNNIAQTRISMLLLILDTIEIYEQTP